MTDQEQAMANSLFGRLSKIEMATAAKPIPDSVVERALAEFRETGELPTAQQTAAQVIDRVLNPRMPPPPMAPERFRAMMRDVTARLEDEDLDAPSPLRRCARTALHHEAVYGDAHDRYVAGRILARHADCGMDVRAVDYLAEVELPDRGACGRHRLVRRLRASAEALHAPRSRLHHRIELSSMSTRQHAPGVLLARGVVQGRAVVLDEMLDGPRLLTLDQACEAEREELQGRDSRGQLGHPSPNGQLPGPA